MWNIQIWKSIFQAKQQGVKIMRKYKTRKLATITALMLAAFGIMTFTQSAASGRNPIPGLTPQSKIGGVGAVYVMTNGVHGNAVVYFRRAADGSLANAGTISTGGRGTGNLLENQGSLILSEGGEWLFAANPGSDEITVFKVIEGDGLEFVQKISSGGDRPVSLTVSENLLYVLNTGSEGNITGFNIGSDGSLSPIANSTRALSLTQSEICPPLVTDAGDPHALCSLTGATTVGFNPNGDFVVVTERLPDRIDTFTVGDDGRLTLVQVFQTVQDSTPFGFAFAKRGRLVVANAFLDEVGRGAASSYILSATGNLAPTTATLGNGQAASCWVIITNNGRYAYTSNPVSDSLTSYTIQENGSITLLRASAADLTGGDPRDPGMSDNGRYLYILNNITAVVSSFRVEGDGSLTLLRFDAGHGFPAGANGLAAR